MPGVIHLPGPRGVRTGPPILRPKAEQFPAYGLLTTGSDTSNVQSYTTASVRPGPYHTLVLFALTSVSAFPTSLAASVQGLDLAWGLQATSDFFSNAAPTDRVNIFTAYTGNNPRSAALTITTVAAQAGAAWVLLELYGLYYIPHPIGSSFSDSSVTTPSASLTIPPAATSLVFAAFGANNAAQSIAATAASGGSTVATQNYLTPNTELGVIDARARQTATVSQASGRSGALIVEFARKPPDDPDQLAPQRPVFPRAGRIGARGLAGPPLVIAQTTPDFTAPILISDSASGTGSETPTLAADLSGTDANSTTIGTPDLLALISGTDAGAGLDTAAMGADLSATDSGSGSDSATVDAALPVSGTGSGADTARQVVWRLLTGGSDTTDQSTYATASVAPRANMALLVFVSNSQATTPPSGIPALSGLGLTFVELVDVPWLTSANAGRRTSAYLALTGASPGSGAITIDFAGATQQGCLWTVVEVTGSDIDNYSTAIRQFATAFSDSGVTSGTVSLGSAPPATSRSLTVYGSGNNPSTLAPSGGGVLLDTETHGTPNQSQDVIDSGSATTQAATFTSARYAAIILELPVPAAQIVGSEAGSGSVAATLVADLTGTDSGSGSDVAVLTVAVSASDTNGTTTEAVALALLASESGTGTDAAVIAAALTGTDADGSTTESAAIAQSVTDSGSGLDAASVDTGIIPVSSTDSGSGSDSASIAAALAGSDAGTGTDHSGYRDRVYSQDPVSYWRLDEASGNPADQMGRNPGTLVGTPSYAQPGLLNEADTAVVFDGATRVDIADSPSLLLGSDSWTFEAWVKTTVTGVIQAVLAKSGGAAGNPGIRIYTTTGGLFGIQLADGVTLYSRNSSGANTNDGLAHYCVGIVDRAANLLRVYVDGLPAGTADITGAGSATNALALRIGSQTAGGTFFTGTLDEVAIYHYALSDAEIALHWQLGIRALPYALVGVVAAETGAGVDSPTTIAQTSLDLTASSSASASVAADLAGTATGTGIDSVTGIALVAADTGSGLDTATVAAAISVSQAGSVNDHGDFRSVITGAGAIDEWALNETSGTVAADSIGINTGAYLGTPTLAQTGLVLDGGTSVLFDGATQYVEVPDDNSLKPGTAARTYMAWFRSDGSVGANQTISAKGGAGAGAAGWQFAIIDGSLKAQFALQDGTNTFNINSVATYLGDGRRHFIVGVIDRIGNTGYLYIDGVQVASADITTLGSITSNQKLRIGANSASTAAKFFKGIVDEVVSIPYALSAADVARLYDLGITAGPAARISVLLTDTGSGADAAIATVPVSASDTGSGSATVTGIGVIASDNGSGAAVATVTAAISASDVGAGAEVGSAGTPIFDTDSGSGADTALVVAAAVSASDSGSGAATASVVTDDIAKFVTDTGSGASEASLLAQLTGADSGGTANGLILEGGWQLEGAMPIGGSEASDIAAVDSRSDVGSGSASASVTAASVSAADTGSGVAVAAVATAVAASDTGAGTSAQTLAAALSDSQLLVGLESTGIAISLTDSGSGLDSASYVTPLVASDTGSATDTASLGLTGAESAVGTAAASLAAQTSASDSGTASETPSNSLGSSDTGSGATATGVGILVDDVGAGTPGATDIAQTRSDTGHGIDAVSVPNVMVVETGTATEVASLSATLSVLENAAGTDLYILDQGNEKFVTDLIRWFDLAPALSAAIASSASGSDSESVGPIGVAPAADAGSGIDSVVGANAVASDIGHGTATASVEAALAAAATGTLHDSASGGTQISAVDSGTESESVSMVHQVGDTGHGTDFASVADTFIVASDTGHSVQTAHADAVPTASDAGHGLDTAAIAASLADSQLLVGTEDAVLSMRSVDAGDLQDFATLEALFLRSEVLHGTDTPSLAADLLVSDLLHLADAAGLAVLVVDSGSFADLATLRAAILVVDSGFGHDQLITILGRAKRIALIGRYDPVVVVVGRHDPIVVVIGRADRILELAGRYDPDRGIPGASQEDLMVAGRI